MSCVCYYYSATNDIVPCCGYPNFQLRTPRSEFDVNAYLHITPIRDATSNMELLCDTGRHILRSPPSLSRSPGSRYRNTHVRAVMFHVPPAYAILRCASQSDSGPVSTQSILSLGRAYSKFSTSPTIAKIRTSWQFQLAKLDHITSTVITPFTIVLHTCRPSGGPFWACFWGVCGLRLGWSSSQHRGMFQRWDRGEL